MIGIVCAMVVEAEKFRSLMTDKAFENISGTEFVKGKLWGKETVLAVSGIGKVNAAVCTQAMIMRYSPSLIINSGVAGGIDPSLKICDAVVADFVVQHDMDTSPVGDPIRFISGINTIQIPCDTSASAKLFDAAKEAGVHCLLGTIASGDQFINSREKKEFISNTFSAIACEMEAGAIGHACYRSSVPFCALRSISDNADDESPMSYNEFVKVAADNLVNIMKNFFAAF